MAITFDKTLGSATSASASTLSITTTNAAASGARVVVCVSWFNPGTSMSCTIGGTSATKDKQIDNGSDHFAVFSLVVAGGLAASSTITATATGGSGGFLMAACSYLGTTAVDVTSSNTTTGTGFSSGSATNALADSVFVGGAGNETATTSVGGTNTNGTSRFDLWNSGSQQGMRMLDKITTTIAAQALTGTWASSSSATTGALVIYKGTAGGGTTFNDSSAGTLVLSGAVTEAKVGTDAAAGALVFSGARSEAKVGTDAAAGALVFGGARSEAAAFTHAAAGSLVFGGAVTQAKTGTDAGTGTLLFSGAATEGKAATDAPAGTLLFSGSGSAPGPPANLATPDFVIRHPQRPGSMPEHVHTDEQD